MSLFSFYDWCIDISLSNLRKENSRKFVCEITMATGDVITVLMMSSQQLMILCTHCPFMSSHEM